MNDFMNLWAPLFYEFEDTYPELASQVVEWCPLNETEIIVKLYDGTVYAYDSADRRYSPYFESRVIVEDVDERRWRESFSIRLRNRMKRNRVTSDELSYMTGISRITISKYMNGRATPSGYNLERIANALGCYIRDLTVFKKERRG